MIEQARISNSCTGYRNHEPAADGFACVYEEFEVVVTCSSVNEQGLYITQTIPPGEYAIIGATENEVTIAEYFDDVPDFGPDFFADKIMLGSQPANNVNFVLAESRNVFWRYG